MQGPQRPSRLVDSCRRGCTGRPNGPLSLAGFAMHIRSGLRRRAEEVVHCARDRSSQCRSLRLGGLDSAPWEDQSSRGCSGHATRLGGTYSSTFRARNEDSSKDASRWVGAELALGEPARRHRVGPRWKGVVQESSTRSYPESKRTRAVSSPRGNEPICSAPGSIRRPPSRSPSQIPRAAWRFSVMTSISSLARVPS